MSYVNYHIDDIYSSRLLQLRIFIVNAFYSVAHFFSISNFKTGLVSTIDKKLRKVYFISEGMLSSLKEDTLTQKEASIIYSSAQKCLAKYLDLYSSVQKISPILNQGTREVTDKTLENFYEIESYIRKVSFSDTPSSPDDTKLTEIASNISIQALSN